MAPNAWRGTGQRDFRYLMDFDSLQRRVDKFLHFVHVHPFRIPQPKILDAVFAARKRRYVVLWNIESGGVAAPLTLLEGDLTFARKQPVEKKSRRMRIGGLVHKQEAGSGCLDDRRFLHAPRVQNIHGQLLVFGSQYFARGREKQESQFALSEPIHRLARVLAQHEIHLGQEPPKKMWSKLRMEIDESAPLATAGGSRVHGSDLAFPLRIEDVPVRSQFGRLHQLGVIRHHVDMNTDARRQNKFSLGV